MTRFVASPGTEMPVDFNDINGELNEGRGRDLHEIASIDGHADPEINIYMYKPDRPAAEERIARELDRARAQGAFFSYHYGPTPFSLSPWPETFSSLLGDYPSWRDHLMNLGLDIS